MSRLPVAGAPRQARKASRVEALSGGAFGSNNRRSCRDVKRPPVGVKGLPGNGEGLNVADTAARVGRRPGAKVLARPLALFLGGRRR
jgi:hypothetical protein